MNNITVTRIEGVAYAIYIDGQYGAVACAILTKDGEIKAGWVAPEFRGQGLFKLLGREIMVDVQAGKYPDLKEIFAYCAPDNEIVNHINRKGGFKLEHRWYYPLKREQRDEATNNEG